MIGRTLSNRRLAAWIAVAALCGMATGQQARAQDTYSRVGGPILPNEAQRSGIITRQMPIIPHLPHDPDRDDFYQTRRGDRPVNRPNWMCTSGLYGLPLKTDCSLAVSPYFRGSPGGQVGPMCQPISHRLVNNFVHPWRPVAQYYSGGTYAPVYDLDPMVPGPGPFPWSFLYHRQPMGG